MSFRKEPDVVIIDISEIINKYINHPSELFKYLPIHRFVEYFTTKDHIGDFESMLFEDIERNADAVAIDNVAEIDWSKISQVIEDIFAQFYSILDNALMINNLSIDKDYTFYTWIDRRGVIALMDIDLYWNNLDSVVNFSQHQTTKIFGNSYPELVG